MNSKDDEESQLKRNAFGILKGKIEISDDFDSPIDSFKEYI